MKFKLTIHNYSLASYLFSCFFSVYLKNTPPTILNWVSRVEVGVPLTSSWPWKGQFYQFAYVYS
jgi:hypothetical protein